MLGFGVRHNREAYEMKGLSFMLVAALAGCGASHKAAWEVKSGAQPGVSGDAAALVKQGDDLWQKRDDRASLEKAIEAWDKATTINPNDCETLAKLSRAYFLLADGHIGFEGEGAKDKILQTHEKGMNAAERGLVACSPKFKAKVEGGAKMEDALDTLDKNAVPALYWYTSNLGRWANPQGLATVLKYKAKIKAQIEKCMALDEHYFYSAPHRYLGVIYAKAPPIAGGDLVKAKEHFDKSIENSPKYLATTVLWAEFYAVKAEDKKGFQEQLEWVTKQPDDLLPEMIPETKVEKKKAQRLLSQIGEKF
jgi:tetratricopeptide (TPR) repeat protein